MTDTPDDINSILSRMTSNQGSTLADLTGAGPLLLVFLRHLGCSFCRQTLADLQIARDELDTLGVGIGLVHMASDEEAADLFGRYGLDQLPRFADAERRFYRTFGLPRASMRELVSPQIVKQALRASSQHGGRLAGGNLLQMPGVFLVDQGHIVAGSQLVTAAERPNYVAVVAEHFSLRIVSATTAAA